MKKIIFKAGKIKLQALLITLGSVLVVALVFATLTIVKAEIQGGSPQSGATSKIKTIYDHLKDDLSFGSDAAGAPDGWGDWGAYWNRIRWASEWVPSGDATTTDVRSGKIFYNTTRNQATGVAEAAGPCPLQQWYDSHASATPTNNCNLTWLDAVPGVAGDDTGGDSGTINQDPRTGLIWSQNLKLDVDNSVQFTAAFGSTWNWNGTDNAQGVNNKAANGGVAPGKTAQQLCSERGNGWRLPTEKELMQAYIDGSRWNLTSTASNFWSFTETDAGNAWAVLLSTGYTFSVNKSTFAFYVRCVR